MWGDNYGSINSKNKISTVTRNNHFWDHLIAYNESSDGILIETERDNLYFYQSSQENKEGTRKSLIVEANLKKQICQEFNKSKCIEHVVPGLDNLLDFQFYISCKML
jgi:hypothetical protein